MRLKDWNMNPTYFCRKSISSDWFILSRCLPFMTTSPLVTGSSPASIFSRVDLPLPLRPIMQQNSPGIICRSIPLRAWTSTLPTRYTLVTLRRSIMGFCSAAFFSVDLFSIAFYSSLCHIWLILHCNT